MIPLSSKFNTNTLIRFFEELKHFVKVIAIDTGSFRSCNNLEKLGTDNILYENGASFGSITGTTKLKRLATYKLIGKTANSTWDCFTNLTIPYLLLPRCSGGAGNGNVSIYRCGGNKLIDFGALVDYVGPVWYNNISCLVLRHPTMATTGKSSSYKVNKLYVPSNLVEEYKADANWQTWMQKTNNVYQVFAIGGTEWQEMFSSTSDPSSEYADVEYYAPELYNEYVEGYEESKAAAAATT